jgi:spore cortex formation protein SpoVR/YcgB (stage V sporulation)
MGLAYEIVINSDPCIAYLMEENTMTMQALVIAHAAYGHNSFFKGNYLFRCGPMPRHHRLPGVCAITSPSARSAWLRTRGRAAGLLPCADELRRGPLQAAASCRWRRKARQREREAYMQSQVNELWRTLPAKKETAAAAVGPLPLRAAGEPAVFRREERALLEPWEREVIRIVRKVGQYFYPQRQTQVMNEGWATFWHYTLLNTLYDQGRLTDGFMMEFLHSHSNVVFQPPITKPYYNGINPYALGFSMMSDIRRICENPTEDREWFPDIAGATGSIPCNT